MGLWLSGFGFRVSALGFRPCGFGLRVSAFGFRPQGFGRRVSALSILCFRRLQPGCGGTESTLVKMYPGTAPEFWPQGALIGASRVRTWQTLSVTRVPESRVFPNPGFRIGHAVPEFGSRIACYPSPRPRPGRIHSSVS